MNEPLSLPVIALKRPNQLILEFDELGNYAENYFYTIELCNQDWTPTTLTYFDYLDGYESNPLSDYDFSFTSLQPYTHYRVAIPNRNCKPKMAGNYILKIYADNDPEEIVLSRKFYVVRQRVSIDENARQSSNISERETHQEIDFQVVHKGLNLSNPMESINATIMQNTDIQGARTGLKPAFLQDEVLSYDLNNGNTFQGLREFRWFSTQSLVHYGERIKMVETYLGKIHVFVNEDKFRSFKSYVYHDDLNGNFVVNTLDETEIALQAHYTMVHFTLPMKEPLRQGSLYIMGAMTNWQATDANRLAYNEKRQAYEGTLYLKQGLYNYLYGYKEDDKSAVDYDFVEGNYFETENDYTIFIYHRPFGQRYDELIGVKTINTIRRN